MKFQPIKPKKVSTPIADQVRTSILSGYFSPGDKLPPERELAESFGVSRPSVREALNVLSAAGLVKSNQGGGTIVLSLVETASANPLSRLIRVQQDRALDVIEVRKCMESWTAFYTAQRALPEHIRHMLYQHHRDVFEAIETKDAEAARNAMMAHLAFVEQRSITFIRQSLSQE